MEKSVDTKVSSEREEFLSELRMLISFIDNYAMAESYHPFAQKFLSVSKILSQVMYMVKSGQIDAEIV